MLNKGGLKLGFARPIDLSVKYKEGVEQKYSKSLLGCQMDKYHYRIYAQV